MSIEVGVYNQAGTTKLDVLNNALRPTFQDVKNGTGSFSFDTDLSDAKFLPATLALGNLVKFGYRGAERFAGRVERVRPSRVAPKGSRTVTVSGRGVGCLLTSAVVYPELGLTSSAKSQRYFGWQSATFDDTTWVAEQGVRQDATGHIRSGFPPGWPDGAAQWIYPGTPDADVTDWQVTLYRRTFTLSATQRVRVYVSADDRFAAFMDAEMIGQVTLAEPGSFGTFSSYELELDAGEHIFAARVLNGPDPGGPNPTALLFTMTTINSDGTPGTVILRSDTNSWKSYIVGAAGEPGYSAVQIARILFDEAAARGCALDVLTPTFSAAADTAGKTPTGVVSRAFDVSSDVLAAYTSLAETSFDFAVGPDMRADVWDGDRGADLSGTVRFFPAGSLLSYDVDANAASIVTRALVRNMTDWQEVADSAAESTYGRWETGIEVGNTTSDAQAAVVANADLAASSTPVQTVTMSHTDAAGPVPYVDYNLCDRVGVYDLWGAVAAAQVVGITLTQDVDGNVTAAPEVQL